ncbi:asparagine synthetase B family protein [Ancylobacter lacus]|uniref:asparagine synthetase B family protein n=1 Tax=Ancylobacter lacus TaxID=2579970 RepID=UPI001BCE26D1|nr:asparagine synthase-related protein [Ancylobacter lacus]MBS7538156.1 asparagine synthase [Ancylobacter lacus]
MGICGSVGMPVRSVVRSLSALKLGRARGEVLRDEEDGSFGACDDGSVQLRDDVVALFDGRIDNEEELRRALALRPGEARDGAGLLLAAWRRWGADCFERIIGDYAAVVWDRRARRLLMATDPGALRTLFFWRRGGCLLFATEQRGLWVYADVTREFDEQQMAAWLAMLPREPMRTFFRGVQRVPPGHRVEWSGGEVHLVRWWRPEEVPELRFARDADYEEALREALERAVACRIREGESIGSQLSGGLDSSSVTALAARQLAAQGRGLTAFTAAPRLPPGEQPNRFTDEWPFAAALAAAYPNIHHVRVDNDGTPLLDALAQREAGNDWPVLNASNTVWINGIDRAARERRIGVMLTASMGNFTMSYNGGNGGDMVAGQVRRGDLPGALRTLSELRRGTGRSWLGIAGIAADAVLPVRLRRRLRALAGKPERGLYDYSAVRPDFLGRAGVAERAEHVACNLRNVAGYDSRALRLAGLDRTDHRGQWAMGTRRLFGIELRDPTLDRRLVELCLSIPDSQYLKDGVPRSLIRRAMRGIVPDTVLREVRRGRQAADWRRGFDAAIPALREEVARLRNSPFARECLDIERMERLIDAWPGPESTAGGDELAYLCAFSRGLTAGRFIRRVEGGNG